MMSQDSYFPPGMDTQQAIENMLNSDNTSQLLRSPAKRGPSDENLSFAGRFSIPPKAARMSSEQSDVAASE